MKHRDPLHLLDSHIGIFDVKNLRRVNWLFTGLILSLAIIGWVILYSAGHNIPSDVPYYLKQMAFFGIGLTLAAFILCIDHRFLISMAPLMYAIAVLLLLAVLLFGTTVKGGQRWLALGPLRLQPSEFMKLVLIYMLAWYLATIKERVRTFRYFLLTFIIAAIPGVLILKQPNLGTALVLAPIVFAMLYAAGCKRWHLLIIIVIGLAVMPLAWNQLSPYQKERVKTFLNPGTDPQGKGWQTIQSRITVGSGGLDGKGLGKGTQTHLSYLLEYHTDFIFSLLAEETGFVGAAIVIGLLAMLLLRGLLSARACPDRAGSLLAVGVVSMLGFHTFVNIAITVGLLPVTGIPLPFLSYGGSFYLTTMMGMGVVLNVDIRSQKKMFD